MEFKFTFWKFHGTGNDFVMVDNRQQDFPTKESAYIARFCDRRFGIGADGLILLENDPETDFKMVYFNADGRESSMCGNGGRCIAAFAHLLGIGNGILSFMAIDGLHEATVKPLEDHSWFVTLKMQDVLTWQETPAADLVLNTGSPHYVRFEDPVEDPEFVTKARAIRNEDPYREKGINVNFAVLKKGEIYMRTFERGVEDETYSCGTGVVAASIASGIRYGHQPEFKVHTKGGTLSVHYQYQEGIFKEIFLSGPAVQVFKGTYHAIL